MPDDPPKTYPPLPSASLASAYFPGPHAENAAWAKGQVAAVLDHWAAWRRALFAADPAIARGDQARASAFGSVKGISASPATTSAQCMTWSISSP